MNEKPQGERWCSMPHEPWCSQCRRERDVLDKGLEEAYQGLDKLLEERDALKAECREQALHHIGVVSRLESECDFLGTENEQRDALKAHVAGLESLLMSRTEERDALKADVALLRRMHSQMCELAIERYRQRDALKTAAMDLAEKWDRHMRAEHNTLSHEQLWVESVSRQAFKELEEK